MTLPNDVAVLLREALAEAYDIADRRPQMAYQVLDEARAYRVLAETIENLLMPLPLEPDQGQPEGLFNAYQASGDEADLPW